MRRKLLQLLCIGVVLFSMSGCGFESVEDHDKQALTKSAETNKTKDKTTKQKEKKQDAQTKQEEVVSKEASSKATTKEEAIQKKDGTSSISNEPSQAEVPNPVQPTKQYATIQIDVLNMVRQLDKVAENKKPYVPSNGWILPAVQMELKDGDTAFSLLERATRMNRIPIAYQGASNNAYQTVYVQGIAQLFEFDCGQGSGWMYYINGNYSSVGASAYTVKNGDTIAWRYTCDYGKDM